ncbi:hypothetical protein [Roseibium suaedae]|uniref:hypothetical protein n=1 Tax=Roseibium suaedae TaxID=735517 RepID=UPI001114FEFA|nr:hypothetical protein [Roseibium suaedae]
MFEEKIWLRSNSLPAHIVVAVLLYTSVCEPETLRIWDGDTFFIGRQSGSEKVGVGNIDTPEIDENVLQSGAWRLAQ